MHKGFEIEAKVCIVCKDCGKRTAVPALRVAPGAKCQYCGKGLTIDSMAIAEKRALLAVAGRCNNVDFG